MNCCGWLRKVSELGPREEHAVQAWGKEDRSELKPNLQRLSVPINWLLILDNTIRRLITLPRLVELRVQDHSVIWGSISLAFKTRRVALISALYDLSRIRYSQTSKEEISQSCLELICPWWDEAWLRQYLPWLRCCSHTEFARAEMRLLK